MDIQVGQKYRTYNGWIAEIISVDHSLDKPIAALVYRESNRAGAELARFDASGKEISEDTWSGRLIELHEEPRVIWVNDESLEGGRGYILTSDAEVRRWTRAATGWRKYQEVK